MHWSGSLVCSDPWKCPSMRCFLWILCFNFHKMLLTPSCGTRRGSNPRQSYSCYSGERGGARGELNLQQGNWVLSRYHVITLQYSTTAGLAAISPVDILHVHKYLVTCSKPLKIWHNPRFCWRTKPSQFYLLDVLIGSMVCILSHGVDSLHCNYPVSASLRQRCDQWQCDKVAARHYPTTGDIAAWDQTLATLRITSK